MNPLESAHRALGSDLASPEDFNRLFVLRNGSPAEEVVTRLRLGGGDGRAYLSGGPGSGKTTELRHIARLWQGSAVFLDIAGAAGTASETPAVLDTAIAAALLARVEADRAEGPKGLQPLRNKLKELLGVGGEEKGLGRRLLQRIRLLRTEAEVHKRLAEGREDLAGGVEALVSEAWPGKQVLLVVDGGHRLPGAVLSAVLEEGGPFPGLPVRIAATLPPSAARWEHAVPFNLRTVTGAGRTTLAEARDIVEKRAGTGWGGHAESVYDVSGGNMHTLLNLLREAALHALLRGKSTIESEDVREAVKESRARLGAALPAAKRELLARLVKHGVAFSTREELALLDDGFLVEDGGKGSVHPLVLSAMV